MTTPPPDKSPDPVSSGKAPEPLRGPGGSAKPPTDFSSHMQGSGSTPTQGGAAAQGAPSPMQAMAGQSITPSNVSYQTVLAQSKQAQDSLGTVGKQLQNKNLKLKRSQSHLLRQKISDANGYIRAAGSKLGMKMKEGKVPKGAEGIARFIAMINDGQNQMAQVQEQLNQMAANGQQINAGDMMSVQVKLGLATQEIEYSSQLLGKVTQSITQLMNTQL